MEKVLTPHLKAAYALFLNQAIHNCGDVTKANGKELERKFSFLRNDDDLSIDDKKEQFLMLYRCLNNCRNYYSHHYHKEDVLFLEYSVKEYIEEKHRKGNKEIRNEKIFEFETKRIEKYIKSKFDYALLKLSNSDYSEKELDHLKTKGFFYNIFEEENEKMKFTKAGVAFLTCFFLDKRQATLLLSKLQGFKGTDKREFQATRDCFSYYHIEPIDSNFSVKDNSEVRMFLEILDYVSKAPKTIFDYIDEKNIKYTISKRFIENIGKESIPVAMYEKLKNIEQKQYDCKHDFINEIKKCVGEKEVSIYSDLILKYAEETFEPRTDKDKFTQLTIQFIDDFNLLPNIKFRIYSGNTEEKVSIKVIKEKIRIKVFKRNNEIRYGKVTENPGYKYLIKNNNVFFQATTEKQEIQCSMSVHEIRNLAFVLINNRGSNIEKKLLNYIENYFQALLNIESNPETHDINNISMKELPEFLKNLTSKNTSYSVSDLSNDILLRLEYLRNHYSNLLQGFTKTHKSIRTFDKIQTITGFINRFLPKADKLSKIKYQRISVLLGNYEKRKIYLLAKLKDYGVDKKHELGFFPMVERNNNVESLFNEVVNKLLEWYENKINDIKNNRLNNEELKKIGIRININPKVYDEKTIIHNINKIYKNNIVIPSGFIKNNTEDYQAADSITKIIDKCVNNDRLPSFYKGFRDIFLGIKEKTKEQKELWETMMKDKILWLIAKKYLEEKITKGRAKDFNIDTDINNVLNDHIIFRIGNKQIKFGYKRYSKAIDIISDSRLKKLFNNPYYFNEKWGINNKCDEPEGLFKYKFNDRKPILYIDVKRTFEYIENDQFEIVNKVLLLEQMVFEKLVEIDDNVINKLCVLTDKDKPNRIIAKILFNEGNNKKVIDFPDHEKFIKEYRDKAFHNDIPDNSTFIDGNRIYKINSLIG
jgi:hypothetical protein